MNNIKISIIVPVYNTENYLNRCLDSLVCQTLNDIEIIIVNDGSHDNSQLIIDQYYKKYSEKIIPLIKENGGLSETRNLGLKYAKGEYISFIDSDDYVEKDMCEKMYDKGIQTESDVVCSPVTFIWEKSRQAKKTFFPDNNIFGKTILEEPTILNTVYSFVTTKIYKRDFWNKNKFTFPVGQCFEDSALIYNILLKANKVESVNIPFYNYIKDIEGSICNTADRTIFDIFKSCDSIINFYRINKAYNKIEPILISICCKHINMRVKILRNCNDFELINDFIDQTYLFLNKLIKKQYLQSNHISFNHFSRVVKNILLKIFFRLFYSVMLIGKLTPNNNLRWPLFIAFFRIIRYYFYIKIFFDNGLHLNSTVKRLLNNRRYVSIHKKKRLSSKQKRKSLQKYGLEVLDELRSIFDELGILNFADFGTLLGLKREKILLSHDLDLDYGIINEDFNREDINLKLERMGFRLWRHYLYNDIIVQSSYYYKTIKVDINFYQVKNDRLKTWLFYRKPKTSYNNNERNIVEMNYDNITKTKSITVNGYSINIPQNSISFLKQKYGESWETPDKNWIYWDSPSGKLLDEIGYFIEFRY